MKPNILINGTVREMTYAEYAQWKIDTTPVEVEPAPSIDERVEKLEEAVSNLIQ